jgi:hypothetical protein
MVEPALYVNVMPGTRLKMKKAVCWHVHAICWGESRREMSERFNRLNSDGIYRSIMTSQLGAHYTLIPDKYVGDSHRTFLADKLRYILKSPQKAYRIYKTKRMNGRGKRVACFRQKKDDLRKGDRITLFHLMKELYLDKLAVAGGDGADMMRRIKRGVVRAASGY